MMNSSHSVDSMGKVSVLASAQKEQLVGKV